MNNQLMRPKRSDNRMDNHPELDMIVAALRDFVKPERPEMVIPIKKSKIASCRNIEIGGIRQWVIIKGKSIDNPILLFLHGGPGGAEWPLVRIFNLRLASEFTMVYWDQRGAGKSFNEPTPNMHIDQFISDTKELAEYLKEELCQTRVFVVGHSWGSLLGLLTAQKYPNLFEAFIGVGQYVYGKENEAISYQFTKDCAWQKKNRKAICQLEQLNFPYPYGTIDADGKWFGDLLIQREWLFRFEGCIYGEKRRLKWTVPYLITPEYSWFDFLKWYKGYYFSLKTMWPEIVKYNLFEEIPQIRIPCYFFIGKHDYNTPYELASKYYHHLEAPKKEIIWFENSAHHPMYEEALKFNDSIISIAK
jgi:pimeloyl-ACP methyl ester carboxylesterase